MKTIIATIVPFPTRAHTADAVPASRPTTATMTSALASRDTGFSIRAATGGMSARTMMPAASGTSAVLSAIDATTAGETWNDRSRMRFSAPRDTGMVRIDSAARIGMSPNP